MVRKMLLKVTMTMLIMMVVMVVNKIIGMTSKTEVRMDKSHRFFF